MSVPRDLAVIRDEIHERRSSVLGDENRDSRQLFKLLDEIAEHVQNLEKALGYTVVKVPKP